MFKFNNKDTGRTPMANFEQVNTNWVHSFAKTTTWHTKLWFKLTEAIFMNASVSKTTENK